MYIVYTVHVHLSSGIYKVCIYVLYVRHCMCIQHVHCTLYICLWMCTDIYVHVHVCTLCMMCVCVSDRAEEEAAGRAKAEKEKRDLQNALQEVQDDLESEKDSRMHAEKQKKQHSDVSHTVHSTTTTI